jgi:hypothetical protein
MRQSRQPFSNEVSPTMGVRHPDRVAIKILYTPHHNGYLACETEKQVMAFIADEATADQICALMDSPAFKALVQSEARKLLATLDPALQRGFESVAESFSQGGANALRDLVERTMKESKPTWGAAVAFFVFAGEVQLKGKAKTLARKAWIDEGLAECPLATEIECPNCGGAARLAVHLSGDAIGLRMPRRWEIACPTCRYRDLSLPHSPRSEVLKPASEVEIRRWIKPSPAIADQHPFMAERRDRLLSALRRQMPELRNGIKAELARFASAAQQQVTTGRPPKNWGHDAFLMHNPILATELLTTKVGRQWPRDYSNPTVAEEVMRQPDVGKQFTLDSPVGSFDQHWDGQFEQRVAKLSGALERGDALEAAVQAYALNEDAWLYGLLAPFTLSVRLPTARAGAMPVAEAAPAAKATLQAMSVPHSVVNGLNIEDLSTFLAAAMSSMAVTVNPSAIAALLRAYAALGKG